MAESEQDGAATAAAPEADAWETALEGLDLIILDPAQCRFQGNADGRLWGQVNGRDYDQLLLHRAFPLSDPQQWLCVVAVSDPDADGHRSDGGKSDRVELGVIEHPEQLDEDSRAVLARCLHLRYFLPRVLRIIAAYDEDPGRSAVVQWELLTDRGPMRLRMENLFDGITQIPDTERILLSDHSGNRADIPDMTLLDPESRKMLERYYWL